MTAASVLLPSSLWVRSPKMPTWAICLDPVHGFYGRKAFESNGYWVSGSLLTRRDVDYMLKSPTANGFTEEQVEQLRALRLRLSGGRVA